MVAISLSVLDADFSGLRVFLESIREPVDYLHVDMMEGAMASDVCLGPRTLQNLREISTIPIETHLYGHDKMASFSEAVRMGAQRVLMSQDTLAKLLGMKLRVGSKTLGLYILHGEAVQDIDVRTLQAVSVVNIVSVRVLQGGQPISWEAVEKATALADLRDDYRLKYVISVDGGVNADTLERVLDFPVDQVVVGSAIFKSEDTSEALFRLRSIITEHGGKEEK